MKQVSFLALALTSLACSITAQEVDPAHHLRLEVQTLPETAKVTASFGGQSSSDTLDFDSASRFGIGYWYGESNETAFRIGLGLDFSTLESKDSGEKLTFSEYGLFVEPGVAVPVLSWLSLEGGLRLGFGGVKSSTTVSGLSIDDTTYVEGSLRARVVATFDSGLELFVGGGYLIQQFEYDFSFAGNNVEVQVKPSGGFLGVGAGWRF